MGRDSVSPVRRRRGRSTSSSAGSETSPVKRRDIPGKKPSRNLSERPDSAERTGNVSQSPETLDDRSSSIARLRNRWLQQNARKSRSPAPRKNRSKSPIKNRSPHSRKRSVSPSERGSKRTRSPPRRRRSRSVSPPRGKKYSRSPVRKQKRAQRSESIEPILRNARSRSQEKRRRRSTSSESLGLEKKDSFTSRSDHKYGGKRRSISPRSRSRDNSRKNRSSEFHIKQEPLSDGEKSPGDWKLIKISSGTTPNAPPPPKLSSSITPDERRKSPKRKRNSRTPSPSRKRSPSYNKRNSVSPPRTKKRRSRSPRSRKQKSRSRSVERKRGKSPQRAKKEKSLSKSPDRKGSRMLAPQYDKTSPDRGINNERWSHDG